MIELNLVQFISSLKLDFFPLGFFSFSYGKRMLLNEVVDGNLNDFIQFQVIFNNFLIGKWVSCELFIFKKS